MELVQLQEALADFESRGVSVIAISVDSPEVSATTVSDWRLSFPVLSMDLAGLDALAIRHPKGGRHGLDVAVPTLVLLDPEGRVRRTHQARQTQLRLTPEAILGWIDG